METEEALSTDERELAPFRHLKTWDLAENRREWYARAAAEQTVKVTSHDSPPTTAIKTLDFPDPLLSLYEPMANARRNIVPRTAGLGLVESFSLHDDENAEPAPPVQQPAPDSVDTEPELRPSPPSVASEFTNVQALPVEEVTVRQVPPSTSALTTETADWVVRERAHRKRRWQWAAVVAGCVAIAAIFFVVALQSRERTVSSAVVEKPKPANAARQVTQQSASEGRSAIGSAQPDGAPAVPPSQAAPARTEASATTSPRTETDPKPEQPSSKLPSPRNPSRTTLSSDRSRSESRPAASSLPAVDELPLDKAFSPTPSF